MSTVDIFVPPLLLYCKAISMEWMNANVEFILTLVTAYTVCVCVCRDNERSTVTAGLYSNNNAKTKTPSRPSMQEDYYTNCIILGYYMLPVESCQDKWRATVWSREKPTVRRWTDPTFISVSKFMAQIWWSDCKLLECINPLLLLHTFWQTGLICDQRLLNI